MHRGDGGVEPGGAGRLPAGPAAGLRRGPGARADPVKGGRISKRISSGFRKWSNEVEQRIVVGFRSNGDRTVVEGWS